MLPRAVNLQSDDALTSLGYLHDTDQTSLSDGHSGHIFRPYNVLGLSLVYIKMLLCKCVCVCVSLGAQTLPTFVYLPS
jgi:hypothetical protein